MKKRPIAWIVLEQNGVILPIKRKCKETEEKAEMYQSSKKSSSVVKQKRQEQIPAIRTRETVRRTVRTKGSQGAAVFKEEAFTICKKIFDKEVASFNQIFYYTKKWITKSTSGGSQRSTGRSYGKTSSCNFLQRTAMQIQRSATAAVRFKRMVEAAARTIRSAFAALAAGGGAMFVVLILIVGVVGGVFHIVRLKAVLL